MGPIPHVEPTTRYNYLCHPPLSLRPLLLNLMLAWLPNGEAELPKEISICIFLEGVKP